MLRILVFPASDASTPPVGVRVYARSLLAAIAGTPEIQLVADPAQADVILNLDGRFRGRRGCATVTTVLDAGHLYRRNAYTLPELAAQTWRTASAARRSDAVLVPSDAVAFALESRLKVPARSIRLYEALPEPGFRRRTNAEVQGLRAALALPERYFVFVGRRSRRKNLLLLERAWQRFSAGRAGGAGLVLAGPGPGGVEGALDLGYVERSALPVLLSGALAWLNPSHYEGSALGALEALACGAPALVAAAGALPRAIGRAGWVLSENDPEVWGSALSTLLNDQEARGAMVAAGLKLTAERRSANNAAARALAAFR